MNLPVLDPSFTRTADARAREVFHSFTRAMCPTCRELVDAARIIRDNKVYARKQCPRHGPSEALISGDAEWFLKSLTYIKKGSVPHQFARTRNFLRVQRPIHAQVQTQSIQSQRVRQQQLCIQPGRADSLRLKILHRLVENLANRLQLRGCRQTQHTAAR